MAIAVLLLAASQSQAIDFTSAEIESLSIGKTIKKPLPNSRQGGFYGGTGWAIIDASPEVLWKAILDWESYPTVYPRTVETKEVSRKGNRSLVYMALGYQILNVEYYVDVEKNPEKQTISFSLAKNRPHDIVDTRGYWRLFPQPDGKTLVGYAIGVQVPPGIVAFLGSSVEGQVERALLGLPGRLKKWVEGTSGNRYRKLTASK